MMQPSLFDRRSEAVSALPDQAARDFALDPRNDVVLEASAGTGKTSVLVGRYVRLIDAGVAPRHLLAITFTRKAAAEMRGRVLAELRRRAGERTLSAPAARVLQDQLTELHISTIDAFCFSLLREFPLEAGVDPAFEVADDTDSARFVTEAVDVTLRAARALVPHDERVRLLLARLKPSVLRAALADLIDRRHVAVPAVAAFVRDRAAPERAADAAAAFADRLRGIVGSRHRSALMDDGPLGSPEFHWLLADLVQLDAGGEVDAARVHQIRRRLERYFLTRGGTPRKRLASSLGQDGFASPAARKRHEQAVQALAPLVLEGLAALQADVNGLLARGLQRVLAMAVDRYERLLDEHALLDFPGLLDRSVRLLSRQEEFARSRLKLQSRFHHVLIDEFQDTSRPQWRLMELLVDAWGEGEGVTDAPTSIFIVGDRKQSIYRFRQAEVTLLDEAARKISLLRPGRTVRQAISASFRAVPELLAFINALAESIQSGDPTDERFVFTDTDRFPIPAVAAGALRDGQPVLGIIAEASMPAAADAIAAEVKRLLATAVVRDRHGAPRPIRPEDIAILFRARTGHQYFEEALEARGIRTYVYKGLGFFDAPEVQDLQALLRFLAQPDSDLRAAELLRSRLVRVSDDALARLAPGLARAIRDPSFEAPPLDQIDAQLLCAVRAAVPAWLELGDRVTPSELVDRVLRDTAYAFEMRGRRQLQARENVKKLRGLIRRIESRGYATLGRLSAYFEALRVGDESHAVLAASGSVNLMTIHAAKGLEFPVVFVVNLHLAGKGPLPGVSVVDRGPGGRPEVAFGPSEATALEEQREREELRRLLYVAVTRARDRLYFSAEVDVDSGLKRSPRSLAGLLPANLAAVFGAAPLSSPSNRVSWETGQGRFEISVCRPSGDPSDLPRAERQLVSDELIGPLPPIATATRRRLVGASAVGRAAAGDGPASEPAALGADRLTGTLVHRLFQRRIDPACGLSVIADTVLALARPEELVDIVDRARLGAAAARLYVAMRDRPDVAGLLGSGTCLYELPVSFAPPDRSDCLIRSVIDCVVLTPDGGATVVEFKTGSPRASDAAQAEVYRRAVASALKNDRVTIRILYP